jgi:[ribosomal protein S5]-alanine N-acetyltransferase
MIAGVGTGVVLRPWTSDDADWYAATVSGDPLIQRFTSESATITADEVRAAIAKLAHSSGDAGFLVADADTGHRLGSVALRHTGGVGEVSYWIAEDARGRGAAAAALGLLTDWAFGTLRLSELRLWTHIDNYGSRMVAERVGFHRDPGRDQPRQIKGRTWPTVAYVLRRKNPVDGHAGGP